MGFYDSEDDWDDDVAVVDEIDPVHCAVCGDEIDDDGEGWQLDEGRVCDDCSD